MLACKEELYKFRITVTTTKKKGLLVTYLDPYTCSPATQGKQDVVLAWNRVIIREVVEVN